MNYYVIILIVFIFFYLIKKYKFIKDNFSDLKVKNLPKIIVSTYYDKNKIPQKVYDNIKKYAPNYKLIIYDDNDIKIFLKKYYSKNVLDCFNQLVGAHKADLFRYCYLYKFGGIYIDIKTELIKDINEIFNKNIDLYTVLSINKNTIYQGIIYSKKKNPIFKKLISYIVSVKKPILKKDYLIFTYDFYTKLKEISLNNNLINGENQCINGKKFYLFKEKCNRNPYDCKDKLDRYGLCCYIFDNQDKIIKNRYSDFPW